VGFFALFRGISEIMLAFGIRRLQKAMAPPPPVVDADVRPPIPAQGQRSAQQEMPARDVPTAS
jgi:hypothetical protein